LTPLELAVRNATYRLFVELGRAPSVDEVAAATGEGSLEVKVARRRLREAHALVLDQAGAILMANSGRA
jgi:DNA-directed RNA polymerase specialized sigma subunit